ncbi:MAG: hypothetical protein ACI81V_000261 [Lentimonas sp.]|jgi:hypothetical protein
MKETPIFEEVFINLIRQPSFLGKVLIGGLLSFVPLVNILAFGYLYRFARRTRRMGQLSLPEWTDWRGLFFDGLRFTVVWLIYWAAPVFIAFLLGELLEAIHFGALSYLLFGSVFILASIVFCAALYRLQTRSDFKDLLDLPLILNMSMQGSSRFAVPAIVFFGLFAWAGPLYGVSLFAGFIFMIAHSVLYYRTLERRVSV